MNVVIANPQKNETVERYKFFSRFRNPGELLAKLITDLKLLVLGTLVTSKIH